MDEQCLMGQLLTNSELQKVAGEGCIANAQIQRFPAITVENGHYICQRCFNCDQKLFYKNFCNCQLKECVYCLNCLKFGKLRACDYLYHLPNTEQKKPRQVKCIWHGQLSPGQAQVAKEIEAAYVTGHNQLIWAVTGAGKTEMLFPMLTAALNAGEWVAIATPRIDVCNELFSRLQPVFDPLDLQLLHGQSNTAYHLCPLTICSTHQLIRFKGLFDVLIIDEVDAFPFLHNEMLEQAAKRAVKKSGCTFYLTATPDEKLLSQNEEQLSILPARYHRHSLPVPKHVWIGDWRKKILTGHLPRRLKQLLQRYQQNQQRCLVFFPSIALMEQAERLCKRAFPNVDLISVSSQDSERLDKVNQMRTADCQFLLTTQILERGVTFADIHVIVVGSEDAVFTTSALVQISGRVGRKVTAPTGEVTFFHEGITKASRAAICQIKQMNRLAKERGLIDDEVSTL